LLKQMGLENRVKALSPGVSNDPLYLGFSKERGHKALAKKFSDQLKQFKKTKVFRALIQKYGL
ncbi:MAG: amino acid ABC transporter substrate-binding protein, partial [Desulfobacteraceae bacterium]|nr:amino acid ABC transporter substrate-binding protein [Desulfobacteraceae bacterium]